MRHVVINVVIGVFFGWLSKDLYDSGSRVIGVSVAVAWCVGAMNNMYSKK